VVPRLFKENVLTVSHLDSYLDALKNIPARGRDSLRKSAGDFVEAHIRSFDHFSRTTGLLFGEVQSGKTSHMFAIIAAIADADPGFKTFVLLTANNINLQEQTFKRALAQLSSFNVCNEFDDARFILAGESKPSLVILKKDPNVLKSWNSHFASAHRINSGPVFILDDEADNASQNTQVNKKQESTTFNRLVAMRELGTSSIYLQVTATPQALLLQAKNAKNRPAFRHYFEPGPGYLGGKFFFTSPQPTTQIYLPPQEPQLLLSPNEENAHGLVRALATFLVVCAHFHNIRESNANFLIHPSHRQQDHTLVKSKVDRLLQRFRTDPESPENATALQVAHADLSGSFPDLVSFDQVITFLTSGQKVNTFVLNSSPEAERGNSFETEFNIVVGGNTLGRGVTFSKLQTVYYIRSSQTPQADTYWQHSRMFGYDRVPGLIRLFMPASSFKTFSVLFEANENLIGQLRHGDIEDISLAISKGVRPTRSNVVDRSAYEWLVGGTNYFPSDPNEANYSQILDFIQKLSFEPHGQLISPQIAKDILLATKTSDNAGWPVEAFVAALDALAARPSPAPVRLLVRNDRNIKKDTGTLLSPDDRAIGALFPGEIVITLYELVGSKDKGWQGKPFWIANVKLPAGLVYHRSY
jgi:hypothetical protein